MTTELDYAAIAKRVRNEHLLDESGLLKSGGRAEVLSAIGTWGARGLRAHVFVGRGRDLNVLSDLWTAMQADDRLDLLLVFNGREWTARGWGLGKDAISNALVLSEPALREYHGRGLARALDQLGAAAVASASKVPPKSSSGSSLVGLTGAGIVAALAVGGLAFVLRRRARVASEARGEFEAAKSSAERAYAELILAAEGLDTREAQELQLKAADIKTRLDALIREAQGHASKMTDPLILGKIGQFDTELAALRSTVLQKTRRVEYAEGKSRSEPAERGDAQDDGADRMGEVPVRRHDRSS